MAAEPENGEPVADERSIRPYIFSPMPLKTLARRLASVLCLMAIDITGLVIGLYAALALRSLIVDPRPILWGLLWDHETDWLAFLILLLVLVFWQAGLYKPRETREAAARVVPSVILVAALSLAFAIGTGQHFTTFGLYIAAAAFVAALIGVFRGSYELLTGNLLRAAGVRRRAMLVGETEQRLVARDARREPRWHLLRVRRGVRARARSSSGLLAQESLDEIVVADTGLDDGRLLEIVEAAHGAASKCGSLRARPSCWSNAASTCRGRVSRSSSCAHRSSPARNGRPSEHSTSSSAR